MGRLALSVKLWIEKHKRVAVLAANGGFNHHGGQAARCPPYKYPPPRRVENREAFSTVDIQATCCGWSEVDGYRYAPSILRVFIADPLAREG